MVRRLSIRMAWVASLLFSAANPAWALEKPGAPAEPVVDFARHIYPLLRRSCFECHGERKQEADLRLDQRNAVLESGLVVPGRPDDSELFRRIALPAGDDAIMPAIGEPLKRREVAAIRRWILQGASWPESMEVPRHWAYVPPQRPQVPAVADEWANAELDLFVLEKLQQAGLKPSPRAESETLVRRLFLDLIGLPPSPEEVDAYLADPSPGNTERLVDDLLARPQFGERWARHWLDLARYADSHGFQRDDLRDVWAYRDWVIQALNDDMPFDQFTIEQLAGDLLPNATQPQRIATGFHRCTPTNVEAGSIPEETRIEQVIDRVNTTATVWLGATLECAQCHDHKYDPFTVKDYYRLLAYFNSTQAEAERESKTPSSIKFQGPSMPLADPQRDAKRAKLQSQLALATQRIEQRRQDLAAQLESWAADFADGLDDLPQTHVLEVPRFESQGSTDSHQRLDDGSILLVGDDPPVKDVYTVHVRGNISGVRGFRLDVLTHESLPGSGPGRGDAARPNFILSEFTAHRVTPASTPDGRPSEQALHFRSAIADFSQKNWEVAKAIDGAAKTGWAIAPEFGKPHWATFLLAKSLDLDGETELVFRLSQQYGGSRTIGRFKLSAITGNLDLETVPAEVADAAKRDPKAWSKEDRRRLLDYCQSHDTETERLRRDAAQLEKQWRAVAPDTTLVMVELDSPRPTHIFERGDYRNPGAAVTPGTPEVLHPTPEGPANRLTLAKWLIDPANPLVARVAVNRWWAELFGRGIVATPEDFGLKGEPPTHPELLDWLAVEFMEHGWSLKHLLKTIVLSATYQQSSHVTPELLAMDDLNRWLARGPRFRMDAEMIRDNALAISGLLSLKQFGGPIRPYQPEGIWRKLGGMAYDYVVSPGDEQHRRGIYVVLKRSAPYPSFVNFDAAARLTCTVQRSRTNTPMQALTLLNDPVYVEAAKALAHRVLTRDDRDDLDGDLAYAFRLCTARRPSEEERRALRTLYDQQWSAAKANPAGTKKLFDGRYSGASSPAEFSAWYHVATVLLNLHETITKE